MCSSMLVGRCLPYPLVCLHSPKPRRPLTRMQVVDAAGGSCAVLPLDWGEASGAGDAWLSGWLAALSGMLQGPGGLGWVLGADLIYSEAQVGGGAWEGWMCIVSWDGLGLKNQNQTTGLPHAQLCPHSPQSH